MSSKLEGVYQCGKCVGFHQQSQEEMGNSMMDGPRWEPFPWIQPCWELEATPSILCLRCFRSLILATDGWIRCHQMEHIQSPEQTPQGSEVGTGTTEKETTWGINIIASGATNLAIYGHLMSFWNLKSLIIRSVGVKHSKTIIKTLVFIGPAFSAAIAGMNHVVLIPPWS